MESKQESSPRTMKDERDAYLTLQALEGSERKEFGESLLLEADSVYALNDRVHAIFKEQKTDKDEEERLNALAIATLLEADRVELEKRQDLYPRVIQSRNEHYDGSKSVAVMLPELREQVLRLTTEPRLYDVVEMIVVSGTGVKVARLEVETLNESYKLSIHVEWSGSLLKYMEDMVAQHFRKLYDWEVKIYQTFSHVNRTHCIHVQVQLPATPLLELLGGEEECVLTLTQIKQKLMESTEEPILYDIIETMLRTCKTMKIYHIDVRGTGLYKMKLRVNYPPTSLSLEEEEEVIVKYFNRYYRWSLSFEQRFSHSKRTHCILIKASSLKSIV